MVVGIGFNTNDAGNDLTEHRRRGIVLNVSLNGVKFEVEGHSLSNETATIFNSNCIWECELCDIKKYNLILLIYRIIFLIKDFSCFQNENR